MSNVIIIFENLFLYVKSRLLMKAIRNTFHLYYDDVFVQGGCWCVSLCFFGTIIHSCVFSFHILSLQCYCVTGSVSGDTELAFQRILVF